MDELVKLKKIRGGHRAYTSRIISKIEECTGDEKALKQIEMQLKEKLEILGNLDENILNLIATKDTSEDESDECDKEVEEAGAMKEKVNCALLTISELLPQTLNDARPTLQRSISQLSIDSLDSLASSSHRRVRAQLPKLELKRFSGRPQDWEEFWDGFVSAVHGNEELFYDRYIFLPEALFRRFGKKGHYGVQADGE